jgi:multicomponent Na+:H+ antiporter subunit B
MRPAVRITLVSTAAMVCFALLVRGTLALPPFGLIAGPFDGLLPRLALEQARVTNVVSAVNFDFRGLDTLGEEYILFVSITGLALLLRQFRTESAEPEASHPGQVDPGQTVDSVRLFGLGAAGVAVVTGLYIIFHAHLTPGGGFQGGTVVAAGFLLLFLAIDLRTFNAMTPPLPVAAAEALGAGGYALTGLATLLAGGAFLENLLPRGTPGELFSGGTIPVINCCVGLEVAAGFILLIREFVEQIRRVRRA